MGRRSFTQIQTQNQSLKGFQWKKRRHEQLDSTQKRRRSRLKNTCGQSDTGETHEADEGADEAAREQTGGPERRIQGNTLDPYRSSLSGPVATL